MNDPSVRRHGDGMTIGDRRPGRGPILASASARGIALAVPSGHTGTYAVVGALALYLDFINLFLIMLRFMGHRRD